MSNSNLQPWDLDEDYDEDALKSEWNNIDLSKLSFAIVNAYDGDYYVTIAPNSYAEDGELYHNPMFNEKLLNLFNSYELSEDMSSIYSGNDDIDNIESLRQDLLNLGLLESTLLAKALEYQYDLDDDDFDEDNVDEDNVDSLPANKFIFAIDEKNIDLSEPDIVPVVVTPVDYYNENQRAWYDGHFHIKEFDELNKLCDFGNEAESYFSFDKSKLSINDFRNKMLELGFEEELYLIGIENDENDSMKDILKDLDMDTLSPADCYYHLSTNGISFIAAIVPKKYFEENGIMYDGHIWFSEFDRLKEKYSFDQTMECIYEFDASKEDMAKELDLLGMETNEEFSKFINIAAGFVRPEKDENAEPTKSEILVEKFTEFRESNPDFFNNPKIPPLSIKECKEQVYKMVEDIMSFNISNLLSLIVQYVEEHASDMADSVQYIAEYNDFDKGFYDSKPRMVESIKRGATNEDAWVLTSFGPAPNVKNHIFFQFGCDFLNGGEDFQGVVCVDENGNIKHHFVQKTIL